LVLRVEPAKKKLEEDLKTAVRGKRVAALPEVRPIKVTAMLEIADPYVKTPVYT
jgi:hypothetical protein